MKKFLYRAFLRPYEPVWRLVALVPVMVLALANEFLNLALEIKHGFARQDPVDVDQDPAIAPKAPGPDEPPPRG